MPQRGCFALRGRGWRALALAGVTAAVGCHRKPAPSPSPPPAAPAPPPLPAHPPIPSRPALAPLPAGQTYAYARGVARIETIERARAAGLLDVDLSDDWAPFILQDGDGPGAKPNRYRQTFVALANDKLPADGEASRAVDHNYLEVFGIPPTLSVLAARAAEDTAPAREACEDAVPGTALAALAGEVSYLDRERAKREYEQAIRDGEWLAREIPDRAASGLTADAAHAALRDEPKSRARLDRAFRGQARVEAVRAAQARLGCEGLLSPRSRYTPGMYDLPTHEALATWERKNDIFGWGFLGGETLTMLLAPPRSLLLDALKRALAERVADAAGIVEDGSINTVRKRNPPTWQDADGAAHPVQNLIGDYVDALLAAVGVATPEDAIAFLRAHQATFPGLHVAFEAPPLPAYYGTTEPPASGEMDLAVEIDRGDVWYDLPFDRRGKPVVQRRDHYPHLTLFVRWRGQKIPLSSWRTTVGSWRSELHADGRVYMKYKNSDVGPRVWRTVVATPVWIPPDGTPAKDLLTRKVLDRNVGPVTVVNTDVMGPGYQSAYGLVMGIHIDPARGGFDNQIRTHGSVDYTSIARRFSHGCHRLVNNRAVRLFDFVLRRRAFKRVGDVPLNLKRRFEVDRQEYRYALETRGYYYELAHPVPVDVLEGKVMGQVKKPIVAYVRKPGVDYGPDPATGDAATSTSTPTSLSTSTASPPSPDPPPTPADSAELEP